MAGRVLRPINVEGLVEGVAERVLPQLQEAGKQVQQTASRIVTETDHVDRGDLLHGISEPERRDESRTVVGYDVASTAAHSIYVELGRAPGGKMPPHAAILGWVERKLGLSGPEAESVAWAVKHHIQQYGIPPLHFMRQGAQSVPTDQLAREITEALKR